MSPNDINNSPQIDTSNTTTTNRHDQQSQHDALTSLFRSLTNLASNNTNNNNVINSISNPFDRPLDISFSPHLNSTPVAQNLSTSTSNHDPTALANSLESVVAAAVMQQQLSAAISQHQQTPPISLPQQQAQINPNRPMGQQQHHHQLPSFMSPGILQSGASYPFMNEQPAPLLMVGASNHQEQFSNYSNNSNSQQNQRINYCTICNKELCNKYFMKTHMLKMHGINLEMEQSANDSNQNDNQERTDETKDGANNDAIGGGSPLKATDLSKNQQTRCNRQSSECKPSTGSNSQASARNNVKLSTSAAGSSKQTATSVMNGFAGNSMGGVVCDICNKELCSKYFLKVHKQNTHGIMTDYQDASQFVYPFVNPMTGSNPFMPQSLTMNPLVTPTSNVLPFPPSFSHNSNNQMGQSSNVYVESKSNTSKRSRLLTDDGKQPKRDPNSSRTKSNNSHTNEPSAVDDNGLNSLYRLMIEQQKHPTLNGQMRSQSVISQTFDQLAANQMSGLMCFGAMGPFGPTGITPTMIVEMILRNQHLFSRNTKNSQLINQSQSLDKDKNNNESKQKSSGKNSKEPNNSRYFTHYTEACPMCDRRFKSIKWLKTHMMNDHKQEIGTYMQMMMQNLYMNNGLQQLSTAAQFDQGPCYPSMNSSSCNQIIQKPKYQHPISMCNNQPPTNVAQALQGEQINLIQSYLNQQRHQVIMQQQPQEMLGLSSEPSRKQIKISSSPLVGQNNFLDKSLSLSAKTSPTRSLVGDMVEQHHDDRQDDQLDLSARCNRDLQDCELDIQMNYTSENCRVKVPSEINDFTESDSSTRSSFHNEETTNVSNSDSAKKRKQVISSSL